MRLTTVILIATLMQVSAAGLAQKINLSKSNVPLKAVLKEIRTQSGYDFVYAEEIFDVAKPVNIQIKDAELDEVLNEIFKNQPLTFSISKTTVTIKPKDPTFLERVVATLTNIDASGRVVDSENKPLPGASVKVKKTGKAVSTDANGKFFLRGVEEGAILVVSFIGYLPKEVSASTNMGSVVLEQSLSKLDEVQVIAYGTTTQRLSTGNVTTIKADVIEKQPVNNPLLALQGRVPGLFIEQGSGFAGTAVKVRIQGTNSMNNGNDPLYVIDGIPFTSQLLPGGNSILNGSGSGVYEGGGSPLSFINPADIESIDILKDADATAIYGSRAANGAILISTKKGQAGEVKVDFNLQKGWGQVNRKLNLMNGQQYLEMRKEALKNDGITTPSSGAYGDNDLNGNWDNSRSTDWQKELIGGAAEYSDMQASVSGGDYRTQFLIEAGYHKEGNVFPGDFYDAKGSVHFSINSSSTNQKFKIQASGFYLQDKNLLPQVDLTTYAMQLAPVAPNLYTQSGGINWQPMEGGSSTFRENPIAQLNNTFRNNTNNLLANAILSYEILPSLNLKSSFGLSNLQSDIFSSYPISSSSPENQVYALRTSNFGNNKLNSWTIEPQLTYQQRINRGTINILLGSTILKEMRDGSAIYAQGFSTDQLMEDIRSATILSVTNSINSVYRYNALFGRINYNWEDKYLINLTARRDGSSRFGSENQFHNFGAIGAAWIFSREKAIIDRLSFLSYGKLRASYGTTGSDQIPDYQFMSLYGAVSAGNIPYQGVMGYFPNRLTNPYLQWEETRKLQIGLELGLLNDKIFINASYNRNRSSNQLLSYFLPILTGYTNVTSNFPATVQNTGWEFTLSTNNLMLGNVKWSGGINLTVPRNKLISFFDFENSSYQSLYIIGKSINILQLYHFAGVDPAKGVYQFTSKNGGLTFNPVSAGSPDNDAIVIGNSDPTYYGGFQNTFSYKGFQLDFLMQFVKQMALNYINTLPIGLFVNSGGNQLASTLNRWQKPGDVAPTQKFSSGYDLLASQSYLSYSDASWKDASYIRLKNVSLSWMLPQKWMKSTHLRDCKLYMQGQNLLTMTNYLGLDPESKSSLSLPPLRVIAIGMRIGI